MKLAIIGKTYSIDKTTLEKVAKATFSAFEEKSGEIELKFVTEQEIQDLNFTYRGYDKPTDVLSFQIAEAPLTGQVFICYNYAKKQAQKCQKEFVSEIALLLVHGILHIYGYDHATPHEEQDMQALEKEILSKEGYTR